MFVFKMLIERFEILRFFKSAFEISDLRLKSCRSKT